jgi:hypothetical protein
MTVPLRLYSWPRWPYRGLDFYREEDAPLFRERTTDIKKCAQMLLRFGVKFLVLQGSSGAGKSSFLHAGLIPYLKEIEDWPCTFLNTRDPVIRCTSDPLPELVKALLASLKCNKVTCGNSSVQSFIEDAPDVSLDVRNKVAGRLETFAGSRNELAYELVDVLELICCDLSDRLILIFDQAENVLTRGTGEHGTESEEAAALFEFLRLVYTRNIDVRIIVSLRTEYYGRVGDDENIAHKQHGDSTRSGGGEPYLLCPLRDKAALLRAILTPIHATDERGRSVYNFSYEKGVAESIVDDVLAFQSHGAVTPLLQVICATLYGNLGRR